MTRLLFYTTAGCHLCEQAQAMLDYVQSNPEVVVETVDIATSETLVERYGTRIPVVAALSTEADCKASSIATESDCARDGRGSNYRELDWPFEFAQLLELVASRV